MFEIKNPSETEAVNELLMNFIFLFKKKILVAPGFGCSQYAP